MDPPSSSRRCQRERCAAWGAAGALLRINALHAACTACVLGPPLTPQPHPSTPPPTTPHHNPTPLPTSPDKFKKTVERDPALERRFQLVSVDPPGVEATTSILRGLRPRCALGGGGGEGEGRLREELGMPPVALCWSEYIVHSALTHTPTPNPTQHPPRHPIPTHTPKRYEAYHGITISEGALVCASTLSARYITGRHLPDKAIDCLDEAAAQVKMEGALAPELLDALQRSVKALEAEEAQLERRAGGAAGRAYATGSGKAGAAWFCCW